MFLGHCFVATRVLPCICSGALTVFNALLCCWVFYVFFGACSVVVRVLLCTNKCSVCF